MSEIDEIVDWYLRVVDRLISIVPYKRLAVWKEFFLNPIATLKKDQIGIVGRMKDLAVSGLISAILLLVIILPLVLISAVLTAGLGFIAVGLLLALFVAVIIITPVCGFLYSLLQFGIAKVLGGVGNMEANFNASALPGLAVAIITLPLSILMIPAIWISFIPFLNICASVIQTPLGIIIGLVGLYNYYLQYLGMKEVHKLSSLRAVAVVIVPPLVLLALLVVAVLLAYVMLAMALAGLVSALSAVS